MGPRLRGDDASRERIIRKRYCWFVQAKDLAESFLWCFGRCRAHKGGTETGQPVPRRRDGPRRRTPRLATIEGERDRVADGDAPVRDGSRTAEMQSEIRRAEGGVRNQGQGAIADSRFADADEHVA